MSRPRNQSDDEILNRIATRLSSTTWTLADAADAAGVHPATLIKRFGSRHGVLVALSRRWIEGIPTAAADGGGLSELEAWAVASSQASRDRAGALAGLTMLMEDLRDEELADLLRQGWERQAAYVALLVEQAQEEGLLLHAPPPPRAAELLLDVGHGALLRAAAQQRSRHAVNSASTLIALLESWT